MAFIHTISENDASGLLQRIYDGASQRAGSVANIIKVMSQHAQTTQASMQFYVALMKQPNALTSAQKEMLAVVVSNVNDCFY